MFDSSYEKDVYEYCIRNKIPIERQIPLEYEYNGTKHTTLIDFKIDDILFEVKGGHLLKGIYDNNGKTPINEKLNVYRQNKVILITDKEGSLIIPKPNGVHGGSNGLKYLNKCRDPLIGVDIELFRNPKFPYANDRPHCFYKVRVDGNRSALEAWDDEKLRWDMIKNRINYCGGFIDNKRILSAMNITRTCKQPSWFAKSFAKKLIETYITTDLIFDPFAGWGARYDACKELGIKYIGCDFNEELVQWHHEMGRDTIYYDDANRFQTDAENCSVFICPPYSDPNTGRCFEDYNFKGFDNSAKTLSQCDWLKIVMQNIPNAKEYLMVCKVVDPGWEQYIVNNKINKSHFRYK